MEVISVAAEEDYAATRNSVNKKQPKENIADVDAEATDQPSVMPPPQQKHEHAGEKLPCPDGGRLLSKKTLNYTHTAQCKHKRNLKEHNIELEDLNVSEEEAPEEHHKTEPSVLTHKASQGKTNLTRTLRRQPVRRYDHIKIFQLCLLLYMCEMRKIGKQFERLVVGSIKEIKT